MAFQQADGKVGLEKIVSWPAAAIYKSHEQSGGYFMNGGRKKQHRYRAPETEEGLTRCNRSEASKSQLAGYVEVPRERGWEHWNYLSHLKLAWIRHLISYSEE